MRKKDVQRSYFKWLCKSVKAEHKYSMLLDKLRRTDYIWTIERDINRAEDGITLRYNYAVAAGIYDTESQKKVEEYLSGPCSLLEFLVALSIRIERDIMYDVNEEDQTSRWFAEMLDNLGLRKYDDKHYDENQVDYILNRFMSRNYGEDGVGNVFLSNENMAKKGGPLFREKEIAAQMDEYFLPKFWEKYE